MYKYFVGDVEYYTPSQKLAIVKSRELYYQKVYIPRHNINLWRAI